MSARLFATLLVASTASSVSACNGAKADEGLKRRDLPAVSESQFVPLPAREAPDPRKQAIGKRLFSDVRLSGDEKVSCTTCHLREHWYADGRPKAALVGNRKQGTMNVPTLLNVAYNYRYNWDGKFLSLEAQLDALIAKDSAMNATWPVIEARLREDAEYEAAFRAVYPDGVTSKTIADALLTYVRSLTTPGSKFDRHLAGETNALNEQEKYGLKLFRDYGCSSCHQGRNVGGNLLQQFGVIEDYFQSPRVKARGGEKDADQGHFNVTNDEKDRHFFRVPSLRNVGHTPPYFHDGSADRLEDAVATMAVYQLGRQLTDSENAAIVAFLHTLSVDQDSLP
jgi:cytochrome c peroxidase